MTGSLVLRAPMHCSWEQRGVLVRWDRSVVVTDQSREHSGSFLGARNLLAASLLLRWRRTGWVPSRGHVPWGQGVFLRRRRLRRPRSFIACAGRGAVQREGWNGGAPCGADELSDAVETLFVDVVDRAVAQELVCRDERNPSLHGRAGRTGRGTSRGERGSGSAAVSPHGWMLGRCLLLVPHRAGGSVDSRRLGTAGVAADGGRLGDAGSESVTALGAGQMSVRHGRDGQ